MGKNKFGLPENACEPGADYFNSFDSPQAFWEACDHRPDWMLWAHARSRCPVPWAYAALADIWAQDAAARYAARYAASDAASDAADADAEYAARYAAAAAADASDAARAAADAAAAASDAARAARAAAAAARYAADAAADARRRQCDDIRAALPWFPGFDD